MKTKPEEPSLRSAHRRVVGVVDAVRQHLGERRRHLRGKALNGGEAFEILEQRQQPEVRRWHE
jgi:hypothetical protein